MSLLPSGEKMRKQLVLTNIPYAPEMLGFPMNIANYYVLCISFWLPVVTYTIPCVHILLFYCCNGDVQLGNKNYIAFNAEFGIFFTQKA